MLPSRPAEHPCPVLGSRTDPSTVLKYLNHDVSSVHEPLSAYCACDSKTDFQTSFPTSPVLDPSSPLATFDVCRNLCHPPSLPGRHRINRDPGRSSHRSNLHQRHRESHLHLLTLSYLRCNVVDICVSFYVAPDPKNSHCQWTSWT